MTRERAVRWCVEVDSPIQPSQANGSQLRGPGNPGFMSFERRRSTTTQTDGCCASEAANGQATGYYYDPDDVISIRVAWRQGEAVWTHGETVADSASEGRPSQQTTWTWPRSRCRQQHGNGSVAAGNEGVCMQPPKVWCGGCVTTTATT